MMTTILLGVLLSVQLSLLQTSFSQQTKDAALIHKEVLHEYDTKFVHPSLNRPVRDVGIQTLPTKMTHDQGTTTEVDTYTPTTIINRGFRTNPNPAYASQYDPDNYLQQQQPRLPRSSTTPALRTPVNSYPLSTATASTTADFSSPLRPRPSTALRQPQFRPSEVNGDGGSLGVFSHAASPLRKAASMNFLRAEDSGGGVGEVRRREGSPLKRMSTPGGLERQQPGMKGLNHRFQQLREGERRRESGRF